MGGDRRIGLLVSYAIILRLDSLRATLLLTSNGSVHHLWMEPSRVILFLPNWKSSSTVLAVISGAGVAVQTDQPDVCVSMGAQ